MQDRALDHALESCRRLHGCCGTVSDQARQLIVDILSQRLAKLRDVHLAGGHNLDRVGVLGQRQKQVFER